MVEKEDKALGEAGGHPNRLQSLGSGARSATADACARALLCQCDLCDRTYTGVCVHAQSHYIRCAMYRKMYTATLRNPRPSPQPRVKSRPCSIPARSSTATASPAPVATGRTRQS